MSYARTRRSRGAFMASMQSRSDISCPDVTQPFPTLAMERRVEGRWGSSIHFSVAIGSALAIGRVVEIRNCASA